MVPPNAALSWVVRASLDGDAPTGEFDVVEKAYLRGARAGGFVTAILENGEAKVSNPGRGHGNKPRNKSAAGRESLNRFEWRWLDDAAVAQARANSAAVAKEQEALQAPPPTLGDASHEKRVVAYGLYGSDPKYCTGAIRNSELVKEVFPGWVARYYHREDVPEHARRSGTTARSSCS
ncbi:hypothetical protein JL722_5088 [Aureococcus anophagefferens]|nr:hypothetical protein JL722_5088 [Aureococcus anophagefferens]